MKKKLQDKLALFKLIQCLKKMSDDELRYLVQVEESILKKRKAKGIKYVK